MNSNQFYQKSFQMEESCTLRCFREELQLMNNLRICPSAHRILKPIHHHNHNHPHPK